jgi:membrane protein required for colicin V production
MGLESGLDIFLVLILFLTSIIGLIRGFLKEAATVINWFGSIYLTSVLKPSAAKLFPESVKFPFSLDIITNAVLFVTLLLTLSLINKFLVERLKTLIPFSTNSGLGFLSGFFEGVLLIAFVLSCLNVIYGEKRPEFLSKSLVNQIVDKNAGSLVRMIDNLLGNFIKEKGVESIEGTKTQDDDKTEDNTNTSEETSENTQKSEPKPTKSEPKPTKSEPKPKDEETTIPKNDETENKQSQPPSDLDKMIDILIE